MVRPYPIADGQPQPAVDEPDGENAAKDGATRSPDGEEIIGCRQPGRPATICAFPTGIRLPSATNAGGHRPSSSAGDRPISTLCRHPAGVSFLSQTEPAVIGGNDKQPQPGDPGSVTGRKQPNSIHTGEAAGSQPGKGLCTATKDADQPIY